MTDIKRVVAISRPVAEVRDYISSIDDAVTLKDLDGHQRHLFSELKSELTKLLQTTEDDHVLLVEDTIVLLLQCFGVSQSWFRQLHAEQAEIQR
ncbi:hypothetical protein Pan258_59910 [Symmachiella dynata]|uniref:hypothetical protein n=1 Tax=Symmachiella dynata TaxID=2527995 RepID=UPI0011892608|nr:hypothetical protein [Symmachiella dynata]QDT51894.1 hypothetical protein Pan258_59910 [Symmachiella dynata]